MATSTPDGGNGAQEVIELWREKTANDSDVENYRLVCRLDEKKDCGVKNDGQSSRVRLLSLRYTCDCIFLFNISFCPRTGIWTRTVADAGTENGSSIELYKTFTIRYVSFIIAALYWFRLSNVRADA